MENLRLIVGLGNPGAEYARTRHNAGFLVLEEWARKAGATWNFEKKFEARLARLDARAVKVLLVEPLTFMNASGAAVGAVLSFYRVPVQHLLVIVDDADLPLGQIRLRPKGSSGGHHGLESIEQQVGASEFARLRIGIGRTADGRREITNHVLGKFGREEIKLLEKVLQRAVSQAECWTVDGVEMAMNRFNGGVNPGKDEA